MIRLNMTAGPIALSFAIAVSLASNGGSAVAGWFTPPHISMPNIHIDTSKIPRPKVPNIDLGKLERSGSGGSHWNPHISPIKPAPIIVPKPKFNIDYGKVHIGSSHKTSQSSTQGNSTGGPPPSNPGTVAINTAPNNNISLPSGKTTVSTPTNSSTSPSQPTLGNVAIQSRMGISDRRTTSRIQHVNGGNQTVGTSQVKHHSLGGNLEHTESKVGGARNSAQSLNSSNGTNSNTLDWKRKQLLLNELRERNSLSK